MRHDPKQWREPSRYEPARFESDSIWQLSPDGKPRNPKAFTPFKGGKLIFSGKTFATLTIRFTVPLLFHAFDFKFFDSETQANNKPNYSAGGFKEINMPLRLITRNKIN